ncbi:hypothetical protein PanWU01x14_113870 [Parasponia andersonii]|uniref:Uncharacterized protein n=1 Tax=Parasponia andersonii TaxID=3476 RepID=A0A2P5CXY0_PARAD|nr:hypothetical protein PanWU01x14_113870 [Parasponia andersonii]
MSLGYLLSLHIIKSPIPQEARRLTPSLPSSTGLQISADRSKASLSKLEGRKYHFHRKRKCEKRKLAYFYPPPF